MVGQDRPRATTTSVGSRIDTGTIGRDHEAALIAGAMEDALAGIPRAILVAGEAGIGKSRLVDDALRHAEASGLLPLSGTCLALGVGIPYLPFVELLRTL